MAMHDLIRRLENLIRIGTVVEIDHTKALCRVDCVGIITAPLPWITARAGTDRTWDAPSIGEQVLVFAPSGEMMQAVVLTGIYHSKHPAPDNQPHIKTRHFEDGCVISYDTQNHALTATLPDNGTAVITATGGITLTGDTVIDGTLHATKNITTPQDVQAGNISLKQHKHQERGDGQPTSGALP